MPVIINNACSQDVTYEDAYGHDEKSDVVVTNELVDDLNAETISELNTSERVLVKDIITKQVPEGYRSGMQWKKAGKYASSFFGHWLDSWRSMNVEYFLSHYSKNFDNGEKDFETWAKNKRKLSKSKTYIKVTASSATLLKHPEKDIMVVTFYQDYRSNTFSDMSWKRQYWVKETDERWRIVYESEIEGPHTNFVSRFL